MINVTKTFLPPLEEYVSILQRSWDKGWISNNGELVQELEQRLKDYLGVKHLFFCANGTVVLQMAIKSLNLTKEIITTPFSYVATANAIVWEGCKPVFVDIEPDSFTIDPTKIEASITKDTQAILATHVYGFPCQTDAIQSIAEKYGLKVIYDGAHAFGCWSKERSLLSLGDISTCSFHGTKIFHTGEGGCIITNNDKIAESLFLMRQFGHSYDDYIGVGINGKNSELHAALGLSVFPYMDYILKQKRDVFEYYDLNIDNLVYKPKVISDFVWNYSYYPIVFNDIHSLKAVFSALKENGFIPRRYFYPSLNTLSYLNPSNCPVADKVASLVLCLPNGYDVNMDMAFKIVNIINKVLLGVR